MWVKVIVLILIGLSIYFLGSAAYYMMIDRSGSKRMAKALAWRAALAVVLFALLIIGYYLGWITPHPLVTRPI